MVTKPQIEIIKIMWYMPQKVRGRVYVRYDLALLCQSTANVVVLQMTSHVIVW